MTWVESDLTFFFPAGWGIRKYDKQRFYRFMSGLGMKGVDFLLLSPEGEQHLYLMEVKNYRTRSTEEGIFTPILRTPEDLAKHLFAKYDHTIRAIRAIELFYQRKWWYRLLEKQFRQSLRFTQDVVFWAHTFPLVRSPLQHSLVLWLEADNLPPEYIVSLQQALAEYIKDGKLQIHISNGEKPFHPGIISQ
ncbi:MAG: hypothetical protein R2795_07215 [Saprospiraceae bacterium]